MSELINYKVPFTIEHSYKSKKSVDFIFVLMVVNISKSNFLQNILRISIEH